MSATARPAHPFTLNAAAVLLGLAALLAFVSPVLPAGNSFGFGTQQPKCSAPEEALGENGRTEGREGTGPELASAWLTACELPTVRIWKAVVGGLITLAAAVGVWQRRGWAAALALTVSVAWLLVAAATLLAPGLTRVNHALTLALAYAVIPCWEAGVVSLLALMLTLLLLLPPTPK